MRPAHTQCQASCLVCRLLALLRPTNAPHQFHCHCSSKARLTPALKKRFHSAASHSAPHCGGFCSHSCYRSSLFSAMPCRPSPSARRLTESGDPASRGLRLGGLTSCLFPVISGCQIPRDASEDHSRSRPSPRLLFHCVAVALSPQIISSFSASALRRCSMLLTVVCSMKSLSG